MQHKKKGPYEKYIKRPLDVFLATGALVLLSPVMAVTAILVKKNLGSPVIFAQDRPGKDNKVFKLYKFRSMRNEKNAQGELLEDDQRITPFGLKLRRSSLDELPELWNIIKGDMALVGPRPLLVEYLPLYDETQARRHEVRPGMTGLAQVRGRNLISWQEKFKMDVNYVDNITFLQDCKIVFETIRVVLKKEGVGSQTAATVDKFRGNE